MTKIATIAKLTNLAHFFYEVGTLRKLPRAHIQNLLANDLSDNIASHSFRVAMIGLFLAELEGASVDKVLQMCLFHDVAEARSGDQNWIHKAYVKVFEEEIIESQLRHLPASKRLRKLIDEYRERRSLEAKLAKDADLLDQILLLKEYAWQGNQEAESWLKGNEQVKRLYSETAKNLVEEIQGQKPSDWWSKLWTEERR